MTSLLPYSRKRKTVQGTTLLPLLISGNQRLGEGSVELVKHREFFRVVKSFSDTIIVHNDTMHAKTLRTSQQHRAKDVCAYEIIQDISRSQSGRQNVTKECNSITSI